MKQCHKICEMEEEPQISKEALKGLRHESWLYRILNSWVTVLYRDLFDEDFNKHEGSCDWYNTTFSIMCSEINRIRTQRDGWKNLAEALLVLFIAVCITFIFYVLAHC